MTFPLIIICAGRTVVYPLNMYIFTRRNMLEIMYFKDIVQNLHLNVQLSVFHNTYLHKHDV